MSFEEPKAPIVRIKKKKVKKKTKEKEIVHLPVRRIHVFIYYYKAKIYGVIYNQSSSIAFDKRSSYWSAPKSS